MEREKQKLSFLDNYFNNNYKINPMVGDASFRKYDRILNQDKSYILMDSPPEYYSTIPFEKVDQFLLQNGLSAPEIYAKDNNGFLLLEDFGDNLLKKILHKDKFYYYKTSMDVLIHLHQISPPDWLDNYSDELLLKELEIFTDYYIPYFYKTHNIEIAPYELSQIKIEYITIWQKLLAQLPHLGHVLVLRDYHVENIMHLDSLHGIKSMGLLDFQDAIIGSPIYDIVSILEDAREEVDPEFAQQIFAYYLQNMPQIDPMNAKDLYDILAAQRNLRILGVFVRKAVRDGNMAYLNYIPRLIRYIERDLQNPLLKEVAQLHQKLFTQQ